MARFLQLTDLHVVKKGARASGILDTRSILKLAIDRLIIMKPAFEPLDAVLISGDISDDGSADSYAFARAELERLSLPLYIVPGNHDAREPMRAAFAHLSEMPPCGPIDWTATVAETHVIGLDTLVEGKSGGMLRDESLDMLTNALAVAGDSQIVVMLHHPPIWTGIRFMDTIGLENISELHAVLASAQSSVTVLAGHVHGVHQGRIGHHLVVTAPSICSAFALDRRSEAPVGFMKGPTGCAVLDTGHDGIWSAVPLEPSDGPFSF